LLLVLALNLSPSSFASAYNAHPELVVIIVIDQFRGDYLERYREQIGDEGFRLFLDHGAYFSDCNYHYANTHTAPGHATLVSGAYANGHGIVANHWWDSKKKRMVTSVEDEDTKIVGVSGDKTGDSYDTHVPLAFYGLPFQPGTYRGQVEPVDLAATLASLLGINAPTHAVGRVLTEALAPPHYLENSGGAWK
jgi:arylsulfatase A-like enzyme